MKKQQEEEMAAAIQQSVGVTDEPNDEVRTTLLSFQNSHSNFLRVQHFCTKNTMLQRTALKSNYPWHGCISKQYLSFNTFHEVIAN